MVPASEEKRLEWKGLIEKQRESGLSIEKWCLQNQIRPHIFGYWKKKLFPKPLQKSSFTELNLKRSNDVSLQAQGIFIKISVDCDPELRRQIFTLFSEL